jgi:hypothetical protein
VTEQPASSTPDEERPDVRDAMATYAAEGQADDETGGVAARVRGSRPEGRPKETASRTARPDAGRTVRRDGRRYDRLSTRPSTCTSRPLERTFRVTVPRSRLTAGSIRTCERW